MRWDWESAFLGEKWRLRCNKRSKICTNLTKRFEKWDVTDENVKEKLENFVGKYVKKAGRRGKRGEIGYLR